MIAVDTSALIEIALDRSLAAKCRAALYSDSVIVSAGTLVEALIVGAGRNVLAEVLTMVEGLPIEIIPLTAVAAYRVGEAHRSWGRGFHPARLNFGDCFAYEVAKEYNCPLLYVGNDFAKTDIESAI